MNHDDDPLARLLAEAFDARAGDAVGDHARPPAPRFAEAPAAAPARTARLWAPLAAAAAVVAVAAGVLGISGAFSGDDGTDRGPVAAGSGSADASRADASRADASRADASRADASRADATPAASNGYQAVSAASGATPVHIKLANTDGATYGVGMPVIAYFSKKITDARSLQAATTVTVNGTAVPGAWYFEYSSAEQGYPIEGHFRPQAYWPARARVHVAVAAKGLSAGTKLGFDNGLTLDFATGAAQILTVDDTTHRLTLTRDGTEVVSFPVSLGAMTTPTLRGIKVIMAKGATISMRGPGYYDPKVQYTQRVTDSGEYLHAAPWNTANIDDGVDSSNGCTNLQVADAKKLYGLTRVGDVVSYPNADGSPMQLGQGYGDWNVSWTAWLTGGLVRTH